MRPWDRFLTERDRKVFPSAGWGARGGWGKRPAVLVVDVNYAFCGDRPEPIEESIKRWPNSCGEDAWTAVEHIRPVLDVARSRGIPVFYSTNMDRAAHGWGAGRWADKHRKLTTAPPDLAALRNKIVEPIAPRFQDVLIQKEKPSAFFGTPLSAYLVDLQADSIIVCGCTTGGCIRATVIDAFSNNFRVALIEEGTFDRGQASHAINLFDMEQKYADIVSAAETIEYLRGLPEGMFDEQMPALRQRNAVPAGTGR